MDFISKYLKGNLSESELEEISEILISAKFDRDKKRDWMQKLKKDYKVGKSELSIRSIKKKKVWLLLSVVATLLLLLFFFYLFPFAPQLNATQLADNYIKELTIMGDQSVMRKGSAEINNLRRDATLKYVNRDYEESAKILSQIIEKEEAIGQDYFYLALCQIKKERPEFKLAVETLQKSKLENGPMEEIDWVLALANIKTGDETKAIEVLNRITELDAYKSREAKRLIKALQKNK